MPTVNLSPRFRLALYIVSGLGTLVAAYLFNKGYIGEEEVALWAGFVTLVNGLAAINVSPAPKVYVDRDLTKWETFVVDDSRPSGPERGHVDLATVLLVGILVVLVLALAGFFGPR